MTKKTWATAATRSVATIIKQIPIRRDQEGRYCLNDLHKAAGGDEKHAPWRFIRLETTTALAEAISKAPDVVVKPIDLSRGRYGGTHVHEDLAIDYAAWVSPVFKLEVYRAFKETRQSHETDIGDSIVPAGTPLVSLLEQALESEKRRLVLEAELEKAQPISRRVVRGRPNTLATRSTLIDISASVRRKRAVSTKFRLATFAHQAVAR